MAYGCCRVRRYLLELPYQLMVTNTKADAHTTFKIPEDALVEVGMIYSVSFCVNCLRSCKAGVNCLMRPDVLWLGLLLYAEMGREASGAAAPNFSRKLVAAWDSTSTTPGDVLPACQL